MSDDSIFKPDPPQKLAFSYVLLLFGYHVVVAIVLAYAIYNVWPPMPWPGDKTKVVDTGSTTKSANANSAESANTPTNTNASVATANANRSTTTPTNSNRLSNTNQSEVGNDSPRNVNTAQTNSVSPGTVNNSETADPYGGQLPPAFKLFGLLFQPPLETRLILLVLLVGAIGSYVHAASSFVDYLGNRTMVSSWVWWYLLRPFIGMMLALVFYFVFRGGFITAGVNTAGESAVNFINPFGIAAMAALVGMFSKVAADKLNEVFVTLFRPASGQGDAKRGDKLSDSFNPNIATLAPNSGPATGGTEVTITGSGFMNGATVTFGGLAATSVVVNGPASLTAVTPPHTAGAVVVEVLNPNKQKASLERGFTYK